MHKKPCKPVSLDLYAINVNRDVAACSFMSSRLRFPHKYSRFRVVFEQIANARNVWRSVPHDASLTSCNRSRYYVREAGANGMIYVRARIAGQQCERDYDALTAAAR